MLLPACLHLILYELVLVLSEGQGWHDLKSAAELDCTSLLCLGKCDSDFPLVSMT